VRSKIALTILLVCSLAGFALGWWPEHRERLAMEQQLQQAQTQLAHAQTDARLSRLQVQLLSLLELVHANNYAGAQSAASAFFDSVRAEQARTAAAPELGKILSQRDAVTIALSRSDASVADSLTAMRPILAQIASAPPGDSSSKQSE
jgi:type II secretory pathway pseudopilin PulG